MPAVRPAAEASAPKRTEVTVTRSAAKPPAPLPHFERREVRKLATGRREIEARLDLHGLKQVEAHARLRGFVAACARQGMSLVLVITGKGGERSGDAGDEVIRSDRRGVLKRLVPLWLAEPDLRAHIVSYTEAHVRHGGGGALYVRLRKLAR
ncbi:MAG TPA: Smr/MutS family protein [Hyphomicrobiaceae bacterium]|nr:Smr/MutS family protein [Hyphomicrobiaceae bacterium]